MKLDKLHVDQFRARVIRQRMSVAGVFPAVAGNFVGASNSAGGEYDCFRSENFEATALAFIAKSANRAISIFQDRQDRVFHVHVDAAVHTVILQRSNHLQTGAVPDVRESRIFMAAEISLQNASVTRAIENRS